MNSKSQGEWGQARKPNVRKLKTQLRNGHKKAQRSTKTAVNMLECMRFEFLCVFVFFVANVHGNVNSTFLVLRLQLPSSDVGRNRQLETLPELRSPRCVGLPTGCSVFRCAAGAMIWATSFRPTRVRSSDVGRNKQLKTLPELRSPCCVGLPTGCSVFSCAAGAMIWATSFRPT